jgi:hypothetical protein
MESSSPVLMDHATLDPITGLLSRNGGLQAAMQLVIDASIELPAP